MLLRLFIFLIINFLGLSIASYFTSKGVPSDWYVNLNKAPWTPPGWLFGVAWSSIMICFAVYLAYLYPALLNKQTLLWLYALQFVLNVGWNPVFFHFHDTVLGLVIIVSLTVLIAFLMVFYWQELKIKTLLLAPYLIWLFIACSLNGYVVWRN